MLFRSEKGVQLPAAQLPRPAGVPVLVEGLEGAGISAGDFRGHRAISSIGLTEHIGRDNYPAYFAFAYSKLRPQGRMLNHTITRADDAERASYTNSFINRYVFPDGELSGPGHIMSAFNNAGFEIRHEENLREHYALTLKHWCEDVSALPSGLEAATRPNYSSRTRSIRDNRRSCAAKHSKHWPHGIAPRGSTGSKGWLPEPDPGPRAIRRWDGSSSYQTSHPCWWELALSLRSPSRGGCRRTEFQSTRHCS